MLCTLGIYYIFPWIRWDRGVYAPDQAILIDMPNRRAYFFFIDIWPQEVYYLVGILIFSAVLLFFLTSVLGRVWCGYFCPQTVWTDLFIWVERIFQGDRNTRMRRSRLPYSINTIWRKISTHLVWLFISFLTGGAWVFYFNDAPTLFEHLINLDVPITILGWVLALTFSTYFMAAFAREQVCTYVCPYSRFQSAMFDNDTLIINYNKKRGEPRGKHKKGDAWKNNGHCVDCSACVQVCHMGIDIRKGLQMECVACGLCIDACNNVMKNLNLPKGLIHYSTFNQINNPTKENNINLWRPRILYYLTVLSLIGIVILYGLITRSPLELHVLHDRNPLFVTMSNGVIRNGYDIKILNKTYVDKKYTLVVSGIKDTEIKIKGLGNIEADNISVFANSVAHLRVFAYANKTELSRRKITFLIQEHNTSFYDVSNSIFISSRN
ncbi:MAG: cytochrome c oxidase accessory protein CcoG [Pelagibacterales bacterium]|jgi:cytochrome c oxidase accessory protein FixG|nr:cytochrome c oxidase accessory protein CcoG [Pelagibacterales bacterium]MBT7077441.1 cytochrome c oxidase accessory protein CcoG [Pelagibacterales bacterium]